MTPRLSRRDWLKLSTAGVVGASQSGWLDRLAQAAAGDPARKRSCILLWMNGGPSTIDLWDLKPGHANGGPFKEVQTAAPGLRIGEHLPGVATFGDRLAVLRCMNSKEGDHGRATFLLRTGNLPQGAIDFPTLGSLVAKELRDEHADLPPFVAVAPQRGVAMLRHDESPGYWESPAPALGVRLAAPYAHSKNRCKAASCFAERSPKSNPLEPCQCRWPFSRKSSHWDSSR